MKKRVGCKRISCFICLALCITMFLSACGREKRQNQTGENKQQEKSLEVGTFEYSHKLANYKDHPLSHGVLCDAETVIAYVKLLKKSWYMQTMAHIAELEKSGVEVPDHTKEYTAYISEYTVQSIALDEENGVWRVFLHHDDYEGVGEGQTLYFSKETGQLLGMWTGE